jgi:hypothetical protein
MPSTIKTLEQMTYDFCAVTDAMAAQIKAMTDQIAQLTKAMTNKANAPIHVSIEQQNHATYAGKTAPTN